MDLLSELQTRVVVADGAMDQALLPAGFRLEGPMEELNASQPEIVARLHESYVAAGAQVIRTNSFGGNALRLAEFGLERRVGELNWAAAQIARSSAGKGVLVAGRVGPLGCNMAAARARGLSPERIFADQLGALLDGGAQAVILEAFGALDELLLALDAKHTLHHCPVICSVVCEASGRLADGMELGSAVMRLFDAGADVVGLHCGATPCLEIEVSQPFAAFLSGDEETYAQLGVAFAARGVRLLAGEPGTTPAHIAALSARMQPCLA